MVGSSSWSPNTPLAGADLSAATLHDACMLPAAASGESARTKDMLSLALSPVKAGEVALVGPSEDRQRAVGTPDYLAPELLLGARCPISCNPP